MISVAACSLSSLCFLLCCVVLPCVVLCCVAFVLCCVDLSRRVLFLPLCFPCFVCALCALFAVHVLVCSSFVGCRFSVVCAPVRSVSRVRLGALLPLSSSRGFGLFSANPFKAGAPLVYGRFGFGRSQLMIKGCVIRPGRRSRSAVV